MPLSQQRPSGLRAGSRLGVYEIVALLGRGGMGTVYRARHTLLKRDVALKVLPEDRFTDPAAVARFRREMEAVGKLRHTNIVTVRVMPAKQNGACTSWSWNWSEGRDLARIVKQDGPLAVADACEIIRQASDGLQHAYRSQLVHRDVKPSNLMLSREGCVKLLDLGLALLRSDHAGEDALTRDGQVLGSADYMAPEQALDAHEVDIRSDLYSLGCTLYFLLAGRAPFHGPRYGTHLKKVLAQVRDRIPPIRALRADIPESLSALLDRLLAKDPADRYAALEADVASALALRSRQPVRPRSTARNGTGEIPAARDRENPGGDRRAGGFSIRLGAMQGRIQESEELLGAGIAIGYRRGSH